ncbi:MAG: cation diffusion facilitator family transporter [Myxococcota bacterium]
MGRGHVHAETPLDSVVPLRRSLLLTAAFLVVEAAVGFATSSLALLSDAAHMVSDTAALALALGAAYIATRPATPNRSFGLVRAEVVGGLLNGLGLVVAAGGIVWEAMDRLRVEPEDVPGMPVLVVGLLGLGVNLVSAWQLHASSKQNLNVRAALAHVLADALGSVGAVVAAVLILKAGMTSADAVASMLTAALILWSSWRLVGDTMHVLLQFAPRGLDVDALERELLAVDGVSGVHELHVWTLNGVDPVVSAHLTIAADAHVHGVRERAEDLLVDRFQVRHTTLQVEDEGPCEQAFCPLLTPAEREMRHEHDVHHEHHEHHSHHRGSH